MYSTSEMQNASMPVKPAGPYSSHVSIFSSPTVRETRNPRQMHSPGYTLQISRQNLNPFCLNPSLSAPSNWNSPNTSVMQPALSQLRREAQKRIRTCPLTREKPSGLSSPSTRLWTPRQPMNPLAPLSSVLVAQYVRGCNQVRPQLFSLCHV